MTKDCPPDVIEMGAMMVQARIFMAEANKLLREAYGKIPAVKIALGEEAVLDMEFGTAQAAMMEAAAGEGKVGMAHNDLRQKLLALDYCQPTDKQIRDCRRSKDGSRIMTFGGGGR